MSPMILASLFVCIGHYRQRPGLSFTFGTSQAAQAHDARSYLLFFLFFFFTFMPSFSETWHIRATYTTYYIATDFEYAKRDSRLAAFGGVVLQRF